MNRVLIDTGAYYALADQHDQHHMDARRIFLNHLATGQAHAATTNFIIAETHALLLSRTGREAAKRFLHDIFSSRTQIVRVTEADERRARAILDQHEDKEFSYTDATSFAVMERLHAREAFAFDQHFSQFGLILHS